MKSVEANFDGLVGPTHNYGGLSLGNMASVSHGHQPSNPRQAALQGLAKMKALHDMGFTQGVLPPQERPDIGILRQLGFTGSNQQILAHAAQQSPHLLVNVCSASSMWAANAATVSSSSDTDNGKVHFTPANLASKFHRSLEPETTGRILKAVFNNDQFFQHHSPLPTAAEFGDEGAANHTRFCVDHTEPGVSFFVYGRHGFDASQPAPVKYPARQTLEASQAIARQHLLNTANVVYAQQHPDVIDQGVFHNDVIAVGSKNVLLCHEKSYLNQAEVYNQLHQAFKERLHIIEVPESRIRIETAVNSYLFNSQLLGNNDGSMTLIVPTDCLSNQQVHGYLNELVKENNPINHFECFDLRQSMNNGGGPACLRLRVVLNEHELTAVNQNCIMTDKLYSQLQEWVDRHYRDQLGINDLADPGLLEQSRTALDELTRILKLGSVYTFQQ